MDKPSNPKIVSDYLRLLGNPYAKEQIVGGDVDDLRALTKEERAYKLRLENQYAGLSIAIHPTPNQVSEERVARGEARKKTASIKEFEDGCRSIFRQYVPAFEKGKLRPHHRSFVIRNRHRSPSIRFALLENLKKYDLSESRFVSQFNREKEILTEDKLEKIEREVIDDQD